MSHPRRTNPKPAAKGVQTCRSKPAGTNYLAKVANHALERSFTHTQTHIRILSTMETEACKNKHHCMPLGRHHDVFICFPSRPSRLDPIHCNTGLYDVNQAQVNHCHPCVVDFSGATAAVAPCNTKSLQSSATRAKRDKEPKWSLDSCLKLILSEQGGVNHPIHPMFEDMRVYVLF